MLIRTGKSSVDFVLLVVKGGGRARGFAFGEIAQGPSKDQSVFLHRADQGVFVRDSGQAKPVFEGGLIDCTLRKPKGDDRVLATLTPNPKGFKALSWGFADEYEDLAANGAKTWRVVREEWDEKSQVWRLANALFESASLIEIVGFQMPPVNIASGERIGWYTTRGDVTESSKWSPCADPRGEGFQEAYNHDPTCSPEDEVQEVGGRRF